MSAWQVVLVVGCVLMVLSWVCLWIGLRAHRRVSTWVAGETEAPAMWPLSDGDDIASGPYLRGGSHAARLTGRR